MRNARNEITFSHMNLRGSFKLPTPEQSFYALVFFFLQNYPGSRSSSLKLCEEEVGGSCGMVSGGRLTLVIAA
jgi:hypothetical protein